MSVSLRMRSEDVRSTVTLTRAPSRPPQTGRSSIRLAALRVPLAVKLVGANLIVVAILFAAWRMAGGPLNHVVAAILAGVVALHLCLVIVALRPIRDLEAVA